MSTQVDHPPSAPSPLSKAEAVSGKIMVASGAFGVVCAFLPAFTLGAVVSIAVARDWRGKLCLLGYVAVAVLGVLLGRVPDARLARTKARAALVTAGVVVLMAVWLLIVVSGVESVSVGSGAYLNVAASLALAGGAALKAKQARLF